jgi:hypothetical protein
MKKKMMSDQRRSRNVAPSNTDVGRPRSIGHLVGIRRCHYSERAADEGGANGIGASGAVKAPGAFSLVRRRG